MATAIRRWFGSERNEVRLRKAETQVGRSTMFENVRADIERYMAQVRLAEKSRFRETVRILLRDPCLHAVVHYRLMSWVMRQNPILRTLLSSLLRPFTFWYQNVHGIHINYRAEIGKGFQIVHAGGIFIGPAHIGEGCTIHHNVTIGMDGKNGISELPIIGDHVWIGTMCLLYGNITVGEHSTIASGTVVSKSIPPSTTVAGIPGRICWQKKSLDRPVAIGDARNDQSRVSPGLVLQTPPLHLQLNDPAA